MRLLFITSNPHKVTEAQGRLRQLAEAAGDGVLAELEVVRCAADYPEPQADSLEEVARFGVGWILEHPELLAGQGYSPDDPFMVEDSGLFVETLGGFPGVYSAYVYKTMGYKSILRLLKGTGEHGERGATFSSVIGFHGPQHGTRLLRGDCPGTIATEARGEGGFGYDPIFVPEGHRETFAEMSPEGKDRVSHRGKAFRTLYRLLSDQG